MLTLGARLFVEPPAYRAASSWWPANVFFAHQRPVGRYHVRMREMCIAHVGDRENAAAIMMASRRHSALNIIRNGIITAISRNSVSCPASAVAVSWLCLRARPRQGYSRALRVALQRI